MNQNSDLIKHIFENKLPDMTSSNPRFEQVQMALDINSYLYDCSLNPNRQNKVLFCEAPVGTGKSLGTLIPSLLNTMGKTSQTYNGVVYATATLGLQHQLWEKDLATLSNIGLLKRHDSILAMGMDNIACFQKYQQNLYAFSESEQKLLDNFFAKSTTGLKSDLEKKFKFDISVKKWNLIKMTSKVKEQQIQNCSCIGHTYRSAFKKPHKLTITNQNQLISSYNQKYREGRRPLFNLKNQIIVFDEAHELQENLVSSLTKSINFKTIQAVSNKYLSEKEYREFQKIELDIRDTEEKIYSSRGTVIYKLEALKRLNKINSWLKNYYANHAFTDNLSDLENVIEFLDSFCDHTQHKSWVAFDHKFVEFSYVSKNFQQEVRQLLMSICKDNAVILLSGTFASGYGTKRGVSYIEKNWNLKKQEFIFDRYSEMFDWSQQIFPVKFNESRESFKQNNSHANQVSNHVEKLSPLASGGILILNTSLEMKDKIGEQVQKISEKLNRNVLCQGKGESQNPKMVAEFKKDTSSILVGSGSYFTGLSVEGNSLQSVILTKLPYPVPSSVLYDLKIDEINRSVLDHSERIVEEKKLRNEMMFTKLEQGIGRLIRTATDYGILIIDDPRTADDTVKKWLLDKGLAMQPFDANDVTNFIDAWTSGSKNISYFYDTNSLVTDKHAKESSVVPIRYSF